MSADLSRFADFVSNATFYSPNVPEGYDLVEKPDHKKKRLESAVKALESHIQLLENTLLNKNNELASIKKELESLEN